MSSERPIPESEETPVSGGWRARLHTVVFESDTVAGRAFDIALLALIALSVIVVMMESVRSLRRDYGVQLYAAEWFFTLAFTLEYILRLLCVRRPLRYITSFYGVIDLLAIIPGYAALLVPGTQALLVVRVLRLLRIFRILKLGEYLVEADYLATALRASRRKISVFLVAVVSTIVVVGSLMYVVEGEEHGFVDIPTSMYWAVVTLTTVGYGDLSPATPLGRFLASAVMILGYGIIAVPTGIVTAELTRARPPETNQACPDCGAEGHDFDAAHCKFCGAALH
ncbi:MAG TPA: ion transporter [Abditibacteriaceae bacterium]|jgi:voltage-gated potassium channel